MYTNDFFGKKVDVRFEIYLFLFYSFLIHLTKLITFFVKSNLHFSLSELHLFTTIGNCFHLYVMYMKLFLTFIVHFPEVKVILVPSFLNQSAEVFPLKQSIVEI